MDQILTVRVLFAVAELPDFETSSGLTEEPDIGSGKFLWIFGGHWVLPQSQSMTVVGGVQLPGYGVGEGVALLRFCHVLPPWEGL
jgi:hypothetical protein